MSVHSPVGGSKLPMFHKDRCPGSVEMAKHYPNTSGFAAQEGTAAHELAELCAKHKVWPAYFFGSMINGVEVCEEMAEHITGYLLHVFSLGMFNSEAWFELSLSFPNMPLIMGSIDHTAVTGDTVHVTDLKYGYTIVMPDSLQLLYYGALIRATMGPYKHYNLGIYQPRLFGRQPYVSQVFSDYDIQKFTDEDLIPSVELALSGNAVRRAGSWCRYCPGKIDCPELNSVGKSFFLQPPFSTSNKSLADFMSVESSLKAGIEDAKAEAMRRMLQGETIEGFKPVQRTGKGFISNELGLIKSLSDAGVDTSLAYKKQLKGLTDLRKLDKNAVNNNIDRPKLKATVAPLSDSAPAISLNWKQV